MGEFDTGIDLEAPIEDIEVDTGGQAPVADDDVVPFEPDEPAEAEDSDDDDPWSWAKDADPAKVRKTWERFTTELESVKEEKRRLEQEDREMDRWRRIAAEIEQDPGLVQVIEGYMEKGATPEAQLQNMRQEFQMLQTQVQVQREITDLHKNVNTKGLPDFDDEELIRHAIDIGAPNMEVAYKDMMFEVAQEKRENKLVKDIKRSRGAQAPKSAKDGGEARSGFTAADIANMSEEDFLKNYDDIMKQAAARGRRSI